MNFCLDMSLNKTYIVDVKFEQEGNFCISDFRTSTLSDFPMNPIPPLISQLENPADLNLDDLLGLLREAARTFEDMYVRTTGYEKELQRELKSLIELAGPIARCPNPEQIRDLFGENLILARRDARKHYNEVFRVTPVRRQ